jgi:hypothetical protein
MRVNQNRESECMECGKKWKNTREMVDILLCGEKITICKMCRENLFHKLLSMDVMYDARLKKPIDIERANNERVGVTQSINEKVKRRKKNV